MNRDTSRRLFERAEKLMPGGVNSPVRAFGSVGGSPVFIDRGEGAVLHDVDGNRYVDFVLSWGPLAVGHAHPAVVRAINRVAERGTSFGAPHLLELELAERIQSVMPSLEMVRMVNSGTEAVMSAIRLARGFTGRDRIIKFAGCYHGHADPFLVQAGSGVATLALPDSPGVPDFAVRDTLVARFNDVPSVAAHFAAHAGTIAAVLVEPVAGNMGLVLPEAGFLEGLSQLTQEHGALLVFDEVMTGFRVARGGAQAHFGVTPDLTTLGKIIGGGLPVGAFGGRREIMKQLAPAGSVYQAGTLSGNPLAMAAGLATLDELLRSGVQERLEVTAREVAETLRATAEAAGIPIQTAHIGSMFGFFLTEHPIRDWDGACRLDRDRFATFFRAMLDAGVYLAPSPFESGFVSTAHGNEEINLLRIAAQGAFEAVGER